ncbi:PIN domain-containing protein [Thiocystis violascens]|uniref:PIN domain-containing protein n=1 Tax=Thiocystis violascens TaxID=73141 RepID=UPI00030ECC50|nr:PIN domain-containing protein [Thiocystis violascens]
MSDISLIDANVILRYLLADHPELHLRSKTILDAVRTDGRRVLIPESVLAECVYVMQRIYQVPRAEIASKLAILLGFPGVTGEGLPILRQSLAIYADTNLSFVDTLIAAHAAARQQPVETFDKGLRRYLDLQLKSDV